MGALSPYGKKGDRLWVRETFFDWGMGSQRYQYRADTTDLDMEMSRQANMSPIWKRSIHMPRAASRILLEVDNVKVERVQDISDKDAEAEGVTGALKIPGENFFDRKTGFKKLWQSINGSDSWWDNPWVWVIEFRRIK